MSSVLIPEKTKGLLVGNDDCKVSRIVIVMKKSCVFSGLMKNWKELARRLETSGDLIQQLDSQKLLGLKDTADVLVKILEEWRMKNTQQATLFQLLLHIKDCGLNDIVNCIINEFTPVECDESESSSTSAKICLRDHLEYYMMDLIEKTELSPELLQAIGNKNILPHEDLNLLSDSYNCEDGNREFWMLVIEKIADNEKLYDELTGLFLLDQRNSRNGVFCILNRYND